MGAAQKSELACGGKRVSHPFRPGHRRLDAGSERQRNHPHRPSVSGGDYRFFLPPVLADVGVRGGAGALRVGGLPAAGAALIRPRLQFPHPSRGILPARAVGASVLGSCRLCGLCVQAGPRWGYVRQSRLRVLGGGRKAGAGGYSNRVQALSRRNGRHVVPRCSDRRGFVGARGLRRAAGGDSVRPRGYVPDWSLAAVCGIKGWPHCDAGGKEGTGGTRSFSCSKTL